MTCRMGGIPTICHNEIHDITAPMLTKICHNVSTEPPLLPLTSESFAHCSASRDPNARLDIHARGFGTQAKMHFLMLGFFTPTRRATDPWPLPLLTVNTSWLRRGSMPNVSEMSSIVSLHPLFYQQLMEWVEKLWYFTRDWQMESPGRNKKHTRSSWGGFDAVSPLQSSVPPSYASVEADPLDTTQSTNGTLP